MKKSAALVCPRRNARASALAILLFLTLTLSSFYVASPPSVQGVSNSIVISQVYGGGGNSGATLRNDFIELFNRGNSSVDVTGWTVQYASATGTSWQTTALSGTIAAGHYYLVQEAQGAGGTQNLPTPEATGTIPMSATAGKVALVNNSTALSGSCPTGANIVDFVGFGATANCFEGSGPTPAPSNTTAVLRAMAGCTETDSNSSDFAAGAPNPRNKDTASNICDPNALSGVGAATPSSVNAGDMTLLTVTVTPGMNPTSTGVTVTGDLTAIGGSATQTFYDDQTHGDLSPGDNVFSFQAIVAAGTSAGAKMLPTSLADAQMRTASAPISLTVQMNVSTVPIHDIQGSGATSPLVGQTVTTSGVVTARRTNAFFIQAPDASADANASTSEGILVFTSSAPPAAAAVGNIVNVMGTVTEFIPGADPNSPPETELTSATVTLVSSGNPLPSAVTITAADTLVNSINNLEKYEGMRVQVGSLTAIAPTQGSITESSATSSSNGVFYAVVTGVARPFREAGIEVGDPLPPGAPPNVPIFDSNPERLRVDSDGQVGATQLEVTTGATLSSVVGVLDYAFRTYTILPDPSPVLVPANVGSATPVPVPAADEFTVASFNLERFFDTTNDPSIGEPVLTVTAFNNRLNKASLAIRNVLRTPDIIGIEEMENLATLQAVADKINNDAVAAAQPNPMYQPYLAEGNDVGGIDVGFLVKTTRVSVVDVTQIGKDTTYINPNSNTAELLNDRPSLVLRANITVGGFPSFPVTVIVNHLRSLSGVDDAADGNRVRTKRRAQAEYLANFIQQRQFANPNERIIAVGDFNAFEVNDGYVDVIGTIKGTPAPANEVVLASNDLVNPNLTDLIDLVATPSERYSYSFDGNAQTLDHELITQNLVSHFSHMNYARNDADFPESFRNDPNRPERISDHDIPVAYFTLPTCSYSLGASTQGFLAAGGPGNVNVTATNGCNWMPATTSPFIHISSGAGNGNGTVTFTIDSNNTGTNRTGTITVADQVLVVYQGVDFADVPSNDAFYSDISKLAARGVTLGCGGGNFCPNDPVTREQMAAFIIRALGNSNPTTPSQQRFTDVPLSNTFAPFIEQMAVRQITTGCGGTNYCPGGTVTREQMAAFIIRALGEFNPPTPATQRFDDVPNTNPFYAFIDRMAVLNITSGCSATPPLYCPSSAVTRAQMAKFLVRAFNF